MKRARFKTGSVVFDKHVGTWRPLQWVDGKRKSQTIGTKQQYQTKAAAQRAAQALKPVIQPEITGPTLNTLIESYRVEKMQSVSTSDAHTKSGLAISSFRRVESVCRRTCKPVPSNSGFTLSR